MKWVCRSYLTAFSSEQILFDHTSRCTNQQPTNITFSWKNHLKLEDKFMKIPLPIRVYADFESFNQPQNTAKLASHAEGALHDLKVLFEQIPIAVGFYLISPFGNCYYSYFGESCVTWFVNEMLTLEKNASNYFETKLDLEIISQEEKGDHDHLTG